MKITKEIINCPDIPQYRFSKRRDAFRLVKYEFDYTDKSDREIIDDLIQKGEQLSKLVNNGAANNANYSRNIERLQNNCIAGLLAEFAWKNFLNSEKYVVEETPFNGANGQIDLKVIKDNKTIEVRSSFPRNGVDFAICHQTYEFDVIGPYANSYKPNEIQKDYYVRALFPFDSSLLINNLKQNNFHLYLTGGATWDMMVNNDFSKTKDFIPDGEMNIDRMSTRTNYRVVPFSKSLDTKEIYDLIVI